MKQPFQEDYIEPHDTSEVPKKAEVLVGSVYQVLDAKHWRIPADTPQSWHPGACYDFNFKNNETKLVKGTSRQPRKYAWAYAAVQPDSENGLQSVTHFSLRQVFPFRSRTIELLHHDRRLGRLSAGDLNAIRVGLQQFARS